MWDDLRGFCEHLESLGDIKRIDTPVSVRYDIAAFVRKASDLEGPAFLFNNVKGFPGWRFAAGIYAARRRIAVALGVSQDGILQRYSHAVRNPIEPRMVDDGTCKEVKVQGDGVDMYSVPIPWHSEKDGGAFISSGVVIARDPETGTRVVGINRLQLKDRDKICYWGPMERRITRAYVKCEEKGNPLEVAVCVGNDPRIDLASQAKVPHTEDKMAIAGGLKGAPIELVRCEELDLDVPSASEVILEGEVLPYERVDEGPYGEVTGCYSGWNNKAPILRVKAITMRREPIFTTALAGMPPTENNLMVLPAMLEAIHRQAIQACPEVKAINVTGNCYYTVLINIKKRMEGEPRNVIATVLGGVHQAKYCYVFDDDIDVYDPKEVEWAFQTRVQPNEDVYIFEPMVAVPLDPSSPIDRHSSKMGIDATIPLDADRRKFEKVRVPGVERISSNFDLV